MHQRKPAPPYSPKRLSASSETWRGIGDNRRQKKIKKSTHRTRSHTSEAVTPNMSSWAHTMEMLGLARLGLGMRHLLRCPRCTRTRRTRLCLSLHHPAIEVALIAATSIDFPFLSVCLSRSLSSPFLCRSLGRSLEIPLEGEHNGTHRGVGRDDLAEVNTLPSSTLAKGRHGTHAAVQDRCAVIHRDWPLVWDG
jgi:hypothetical protein